MPDIFTNRETAILIWLAPVLAYSIYHKATRRALVGIVRSFFSRQIQSVLILMAIYVAFECWLLSQVGIWDASLLKTTIIWTAAVGFISLFKLNQPRGNPNFFRELALDNFKVLAVVEFVVNFYSQSLILEMFVVPLSAIFGVMLFFAQKDERYRSVENLFYFLFGAYLLYLVIDFIGRSYTNISVVFSYQTLREFHLPILLSLGFLPFLFFISVYSRYQGIFVRIPFLLRDKSLSQYARRKCLLAFHLRVGAAERWHRHLARSKPASREEIRASIRIFLDALKREKSAEKITLEDGWPPQEARFYLSDIDLEARDYNPLDDGVWFAQSSPLNIGSDLNANNVWYCIEGNAKATKKLSLTLNIYNRDTEPQSLNLFREAMGLLCAKALQRQVPDKALEFLNHEGKHELDMGHSSIVVEKDIWVTGLGHNYKCRILASKNDPSE